MKIAIQADKNKKIQIKDQTNHAERTNKDQKGPLNIKDLNNQEILSKDQKSAKQILNSIHNDKHSF